MKIKSIELTGFRGFAQHRYFDLDADSVIIVGANGRGKTSLFDGILWAITGQIPRIGKEGAILSKYSESGEAHVSIVLQSSNNELYKVSRSFDGEKQHLRFETNGEVTREPISTIKLLQTIWPEALLTADGMLSLTTAITRSVYLQQDLVCQFISADYEQDRFQSVSELVGAGRVNELQLALERARNAWNRATTAINKDLEPASVRLDELKDEFNKLASSMGISDVNMDSIWNDWWRCSIDLGVSTEQVPKPVSSESPFKINEALKQLEAIQNSTDRKKDLANELLSDIETRALITVPDEKTFEETLNKIDKKIIAVRKKLDKAELQAAEERQRQVELHESHEELRVIAQLALRHLGPKCPVCAQEYDKEATQQRLEKFASNHTDDKVEQLPNHEGIMELVTLPLN